MSWAKVAALAATQHGLVTARQLHELGLTPSAIKHAQAAGRLCAVRRGVFAVDGLPASPWQPLRAAILAVDGVASHKAAAALHRFPGVQPGAVELTVFGAVAPRLHGARTHRGYVLYADDVVVVEGMPVTSAARTLLDLAGRTDVSTGLLRRMVDDCAIRRLCTADDVLTCIERADARRGRRRLRSLLDARVEADSHLEARWLRRLRRAGFPSPIVGYQLVVGRRVLVLDIAWPEHRVGIEVDGWAPHGTRTAFDRDRLRDLATVRAGWTILRVTARTPPTELFDTLRSLMTQ